MISYKKRCPDGQRFFVECIRCLVCNYTIHVINLVGIGIDPVIDFYSKLDLTAYDGITGLWIIRIYMTSTIGEVKRIDIFLAGFPGSGKWN